MAADDTGNLLGDANFGSASVGAKASGAASTSEAGSSGGGGAWGGGSSGSASAATPSPTPGSSSGPSTPENDDLEALFNMDLMSPGDEVERAIGGFDPNLPRRENPLDTLMERTVAPGLATAMDNIEADSKPRYFEGDESKPAIGPPEEIARLQKRMVSAGVLQSEFHLGVWDQTSQSAYTRLLAHANARGQDVEQSIVEYQNANIRPEEQLPEFSPDTYIKPDYAELENAVKDTVEKRLGRDANPGDIAELTSRLQKHYRDEYDVNTEVARRQYERGVAEQTQVSMTPAESIVAEEEGTGPSPEAFDMGEIESVDPTARFLQEFDKRFEDEEAMIERREQGEENRNLLQDGFSGLRRALAGGMA